MLIWSKFLTALSVLGQLDRKQLFSGVLENISVPGGLPGLSIASPSTYDPDYYFHWVRDGAINIGTVVNFYTLTQDPHLQSLIEDYFVSSSQLQQTPNLSGGVGEPKFYVDGKAYNGNWGRPQNDGPALRAMVACKYANLYLKPDQITNLYENFISIDLDYIARSWALPSFDLWEELDGYHFFTILSQYGALKAGRIVAEWAGHNDQSVRYSNICEQMWKFISMNFLPGSRNTNEYVCEHFPCSLGSRIGLDAASVIGVLELLDLAQWTTESDGIDLPVKTDHPAVRATIDALIEDMSTRYPINAGKPGGVGRYPEDVYNGYASDVGNPWFICTASLVEALVLNGERERATPLMDFIIAHSGDTLSEQINRYTGYMQGANNLTWSYSAVLRAAKVYYD